MFTEAFCSFCIKSTFFSLTPFKQFLSVRIVALNQSKQFSMESRRPEEIEGQLHWTRQLFPVTYPHTHTSCSVVSQFKTPMVMNSMFFRLSKSTLWIVFWLYNSGTFFLLNQKNISDHVFFYKTVCVLVFFPPDARRWVQRIRIAVVLLWGQQGALKRYLVSPDSSDDCFFSFSFKHHVWMNLLPTSIQPLTQILKNGCQTLQEQYKNTWLKTSELDLNVSLSWFQNAPSWKTSPNFHHQFIISEWKQKVLLS